MASLTLTEENYIARFGPTPSYTPAGGWGSRAPGKLSGASTAVPVGPHQERTRDGVVEARADLRARRAPVPAGDGRPTAPLACSAGRSPTSHR